MAARPVAMGSSESQSDRMSRFLFKLVEHFRERSDGWSRTGGSSYLGNRYRAYMSLTTYMSLSACMSLSDRLPLAPDPARIAPGHTVEEHGGRGS